MMDTKEQETAPESPAEENAGAEEVDNQAEVATADAQEGGGGSPS